MIQSIYTIKRYIFQHTVPFNVDADPETGQHFLETFGRDLQLAVTMFVEHGPSSFTETTQTSSTAPIATPQNSSQSNTNTSTNGVAHTSQEIREPISQKVECLRPEASIRKPIVFKRKLTVFHGQSPSSANGSNSTPEEQTAIKKQKTLAELFAPPAHLLLTEATLEDARTEALSKHRHLLVSLHNDLEFACFELVRDVWRNPSVQEFVAQHFALVQFGMETAEGARFARLYQVPSTWPFVAVIDPRTGELLATITGTREPNTFLERLVDIVSDRLSDLSDGHQSPAPTSGSSHSDSPVASDFVSSLATGSTSGVSSLATGSTSGVSSLATGSTSGVSSLATASASGPIADGFEPPSEFDRSELATRRLRFLESHPSVPSPPPTISPISPLLSTPRAVVSRQSVDLRGPMASSTSPSECANVIVRLPDATRLHLLAHRLQPLQVHNILVSIYSYVS